MFPNKDTPCGRENEGTQERSRDRPDVVDKKDCFLICFVQNIRYLVGTSDMTTISNDRGKYSSDFMQNVMFPVILKLCCHFSVVQSFQFEFATHATYIQGKHARSIV